MTVPSGITTNTATSVSGHVLPVDPATVARIAGIRNATPYPITTTAAQTAPQRSPAGQVRRAKSRSDTPEPAQCPAELTPS